MQLICVVFLQVEASALMSQGPVKQAEARPKRSGKQDNGLSKQSVVRKRQADTAFDLFAARSAPSASGICLSTVHCQAS